MPLGPPHGPPPSPGCLQPSKPRSHRGGPPSPSSTATERWPLHEMGRAELAVKGRMGLPPIPTARAALGPDAPPRHRTQALLRLRDRDAHAGLTALLCPESTLSHCETSIEVTTPRTD